MRRILATLAAALVLAVACTGDDKKRDPYGDISDLKILKSADKEDVKSTPPPKDAIVLFDGKSLDGWQRRDGKGKAPWKLLDHGVMQSGGGDIVSDKKFDGHFKLHVEFRVPYMPATKGQ